MDPAPDATIEAAVNASPRATLYGQVVDRESAYEMLTAGVAAHDTEVAERRISIAEPREVGGQRGHLVATRQVLRAPSPPGNGRSDPAIDMWI